MTADRKTLTTHVTLSKRTIPKPLASSKEETRKKWKMEGEGVEEGEIEFAKKASTLPFTLDQTAYLVHLSVWSGIEGESRWQVSKRLSFCPFSQEEKEERCV